MTPYVGQIMFVGFNYAPYGWAYCDGSLLSIAENQSLFTLIGTTFGGDGQNNFALPDLRGRVPVHMANNYPLGQTGGAEQVTITVQQYPSHNHSFLCYNTTSSANSPAGAAPGAGQTIYRGNPVLSENMNPQMCKPAPGSNQPHSNMQPYLVANWIIALNGIYPTPS